MKPLRLMTVLVGLLLGAASSAFAQLPCSFGWKPSNDSWQQGDTGLWLKYRVQTTLTLPPCQIGAFAEGRVEGVANSSTRGEGLVAGVAEKAVPVPWPGTWYVAGKHSRGSVFGEIYLGASRSQAEIKNLEAEPSPDDDPILAYGDPSNPDSACPLLIDTDGNGVKLTAPDRGVIFDLDGDGQAEQIGWTRPGSGDAWLAMDRNGNGRIDDGTELFGNNTPIPGQRETAGNGFDALNFVHRESSVAAALDREISPDDSAWHRLLLWRDLNHNGISEPDELTRVADSPLAGIDLRYETINRVRKENEIREASTVRWGADTRQIVDVWLTIRR
jgi:hypothetical protein